MFLFVRFCPMGDEVKASECFAGAGHASHEANGLVALGLGLFDDLLKAGRGFAEVLGPRVRAGDFFHAMALVERLGSFDDGRCGLVAAGRPLFGVEGALLRRVRDNALNGAAEIALIRQKWLGDAIRRPFQVQADMIGLGRHQDWHEAPGMTSGVKILQIERIVGHLINSAGIKVFCAHFKFDDEDKALMDDNRIHALTHAWNREFQSDPAVAQFAERVLEKCDLLDPRIALKWIETMRVLCGEVAEDGCWLLLQKVGKRGGVIGLFHGTPEHQLARPEWHFNSMTV